MASKTDICNMALSYLGANLIIDIKDATPEARLCDLNYDPCLEAVLEDVNWSFATRRYEQSSPLAASPTFGFVYAFEIPPEVLRVIEVNENKYDWAMEDRNILTDGSVIKYKAIVRVTDTTKFPPNFVKALAAYLASEIALPLTNNPTHQQSMATMYIAKKIWAQGNDGRQGKGELKFMTQWRR